MLRALRVPPGHTRGPLYMDQVLAGIHQGNRRSLPVTLGFGRHRGEVTLTCHFPEELEQLVEAQLYAHYPEANIAPLPEDTFLPPAGGATWTVDLMLVPDLFPCKRYVQFEDVNRTSADPLTALFTMLAGPEGAPLTPAIELTVWPARRNRVARAERCVRGLARPFFRRHHRLASLYVTCALSRRLSLRLLGFLLKRLGGRHDQVDKALDASGSRFHEREDDILAASEKAGRLLFETHIRLRVSGPLDLERQAQRMLQNMASAFGQFSTPRLTAFRWKRVRRHRGLPKRFRGQGSLISTEELATLWHPATIGVRAPTMTTVQSREAEPPVHLPTPKEYPDLAVLGEAAFRSTRQLCGILPDDRRRHLYIAGKTGMGKSTLLFRLLSTDIAAGRGVGLIDPHGDLCEAVLSTVPSCRTNDVVLFDAGDADFPLAFNILACPEPKLRPLVASGIIAAFKKLWGEFFGPRMEHILRNALLALLEVPGTSLLSLLRLLGERAFREAVAAKVSDPVVAAFWQREFAGWSPKFQAEAVAPIQNKAGQFISNPVLRNILGQSRSTLDLRRVLDEGQVLLCNLSKGRIGEDAAVLLGAFLVTALQIAAMSRADQPEAERHDFYLYVDEFQNYATESFATILSEARKYRLNLTVANQYLAQVEESTLAAVFGNIGTLAVFQVGAQDAEMLAAQLGGEVTETDLLTLPRYQAYVRLLIDGHPSRPFSLCTLPPALSQDVRRPGIIRRTSRYRYSRPADKVEREIRAALAV